MPKDFPPVSTGQGNSCRWAQDGMGRKINHVLLMLARERCARESSPTAGVIDSQSVKPAGGGGPRGFDAGKKIKGRKRHIVTDTKDHLVNLQVHPTDARDRDGAAAVLASIRNLYPWLRHVIADGGCTGDKLKDILAGLRRLTVEIVRRCNTAKCFVLLSRRWGGERTLAWPNRYRRLAKDLEVTIRSVVIQAFIAHIRRMAHGIAMDRNYCLHFESDSYYGLRWPNVIIIHENVVPY